MGKKDLKRLKQFQKFSPSFTDLDNRDEYYEHMILWDPIKLKLIGGQRFKFNIIFTIAKTPTWRITIQVFIST